MNMVTNKLLPSSKLLPATIAAVAVVLTIRVAALATSAPSLDALHAEAGWALSAASMTASGGMIAQAYAQGPDAPRAGLQRSPASPAPSPTSAPTPGAAADSTQPMTLSRPEAGQASGAEASGAALEALRLRRSQIEERERQLVLREATVTAADKQLAERVAELLALQSRLQALETSLKERDEANWSGLVKLYEGMRPREAATIFNALEKGVLLEILDRMKPGKAGLVIASMEAEKARQATAELASKRTRSTTVTN